MESRSDIKISDDTTFSTISEKPEVKIVKKKVCKDENMNSHTGNLLEYDDDIPLIDSQAEPEEIPIFMENTTERPKIIIKPEHIYFNPSELT